VLVRRAGRPLRELERDRERHLELVVVDAETDEIETPRHTGERRFRDMTDLDDLDDNALLDFQTSNLYGAEPGDPRRLLHEHGDLYRVHLVAARWFEGWLERRRGDGAKAIPGARHSDEHEAGFEEAIRDVVAHLRQGDLLPGGLLYRDEVERMGVYRDEAERMGEES
jgi:hypothetical protein